MIEKEDEHIEHIDDIIMTKNDTGSDDENDKDDGASLIGLNFKLRCISGFNYLLKD